MNFCQLKDAAIAVLAREKSTWLAELFFVELKSTADALYNWFTNMIKAKFHELNDFKKQLFIKENPIVPSKTACCICGFLLDIEAEGEHLQWYDFVV